MTAATSIPSSRAWLHMLAEGGRWTARELADATGCRRNALSITLTIWARRGVATRHDAGPHRSKYSVPIAAKLPNGITLEQVQEALRAAGSLEVAS